MNPSLVPATLGTLAVYACQSRCEWTTRTVLAYRWEDEFDGGVWVECVGSELGLVPVDHLTRRGWEYVGLAHVDDWGSLAKEMQQTGLDEVVLTMTPVGEVTS